MKKILCILMILLLTGCNYKELSDLSIGTVLGIDQINDEYKISCLIVGKEENQTKLYTGSGTSITSAMKNLNLNLTGELYLDHIQSIIISEKIAKKNLKNVIQYFLKNNDIQKNFYLFMAHKVEAEKILSTLLESNENDYNAITNIFKSHDEIVFTDQTDTYTQFLNALISKRIDPTLHSVTIKDNNISISDLALFKNEVLKKFSSNIEGYALLTGNVKQILLEIPCLNRVSIAEINKIKLKTHIDGNRIKNKITGTIILKENNCKLNVKTEDGKRKVLQKAEKELQKKVDSIIKESKKIDSDIFGYRDLLYKRGKQINSLQYRSISIENNISLTISKEERKGGYHE